MDAISGINELQQMFCEIVGMGRAGKPAPKWLTDTLRSLSDGAKRTRHRRWQRDQSRNSNGRDRASD
jgi:hypothetical protein